MHRRSIPHTSLGLLKDYIIKIFITISLLSNETAYADESIPKYCSEQPACKLDEEIAHNLLMRAQLTDNERLRINLYSIAANHFYSAYQKSKIINLLFHQCWTMKLASKDPCEIKKCYMSLALIDKQYEYAPNVAEAVLACREPHLDQMSPEAEARTVGKPAYLVAESYENPAAWEKKRDQEAMNLYPHRYRMWKAGRGLFFSGMTVGTGAFLAMMVGMFPCLSSVPCKQPIPSSGILVNDFHLGITPNHAFANSTVFPALIITAAALSGTGLLLAIPGAFTKKLQSKLNAPPPAMHTLEPLGQIRRY